MVKPNEFCIFTVTLKKKDLARCEANPAPRTSQQNDEERKRNDDIIARRVDFITDSHRFFQRTIC